MNATMKGQRLGESRRLVAQLGCKVGLKFKSVVHKCNILISGTCRFNLGPGDSTPPSPLSPPMGEASIPPKDPLPPQPRKAIVAQGILAATTVTTNTLQFDYIA